ncbi:hypothetical protein HNV12_00905 [Methanococcoides sp. SA1]|nr:hypothetical protein [Methanococcoides sp. SA1]
MTYNLKKRFDLANSKFLSERFAKSPSLEKTCDINEYLSICYSPQEEFLLNVAKAFSDAYDFVCDWFEIKKGLRIQLWLANNIDDMHYMTCMECTSDSAFSPGWSDNRAIILCQSPMTSRRNRFDKRLTSLFVHEISHFVIRHLSGASDVTMKRQGCNNLPMWVEEGLCLSAQSDYDSKYKLIYSERIDKINTWYKNEELWNDLSECEDASVAYLQAYRDVSMLLDSCGKTKIFELLRSAREDCDKDRSLFNEMIKEI